MDIKAALKAAKRRLSSSTGILYNYGGLQKVTSPGSAGQIMSSNGDLPPTFRNSFEEKFSSAGSGSSLEWTSINATGRKIEIWLQGLSGSGTDNLNLLLGNASSYLTSYTGRIIKEETTQAAWSTAAQLMYSSGGAADVLTGLISIIKGNSYTYLISSQLVGTTSNAFYHSAGLVNLGAELTRLKLVWSGSDTFDAGYMLGFLS